jgi:hypothetical protein
LRAHAGKVDRRFAVHARGGGNIAIELVAWNHAYTIVFPIA